MKAITLNVIYLIYLLISLVIIVGVVIGKLTFGLGLGDLGMLAGLICITIFTGVLVVIKKRGQRRLNHWNRITSFLIFLSLLYFVLSLTLWRGVEMPWDGSLLVK